MSLAYLYDQSLPAAWRDITFTVRDGLRLHARHYPAATGVPSAGMGLAPSGRRPALCLSGMTHDSRDFEDLALALSRAGTLARDVYTLDYRGRGRSDHDPDWRNYTPYFEMLDVLDFLALARIHDAAVIGTSLGGMIAMILGAVRPSAIGTVVLNDIGPQVESSGWMRHMGRVGRSPIPKSWDEATRFVRDLEKRDYPRLTEGMWARLARQRYFDQDGSPAASYDSAISRAFSLTAISAGVPSMWPQFRALCRVPALVVRGELSDVLSEQTVGQMRSLHPNLHSLTVPGQGHAPLLNDDLTVDAIVSFLAEADGRPDQDRSELIALERGSLRAAMPRTARAVGG